MQLAGHLVSSSDESTTKMNFAVVFVALFAFVAADVSELKSDQVPILDQHFDIAPDSTSFEYGFSSGNKIVVQANGRTIALEKENPSLSIDGSVSYEAPDGQPIAWTYKSDVNGYVPQSDILPTPPPTPELIQHLLDFLATAQPKVARSYEPEVSKVAVKASIV